MQNSLVHTNLANVHAKNVIEVRWHVGEKRIKKPVVGEVDDNNGPHWNRCHNGFPRRFVALKSTKQNIPDINRF
jgi:hypothetical protein